MGNKLSVCGSASVDQDREKQQNKAATLLQSIWRGYKVRRLFKACQSLGTVLQDSKTVSLSEDEADRVAKGVGRWLMTLPQSRTGRGLRVREFAGSMKEDGLEGYWIEAPALYSQARVQLISNQLLGEGTYKEVFLSDTLVLDLSQPSDQVFSWQATVLSRLRDPLAERALRKGLGLLRRRLGQKMMDQDLRLAGIYYLRVSQMDGGAAEGEEARYEGDLESGALRDPDEEGALTFQDRLQILSDVAETLSALHAHRVLHLDAKPANILYRREDGVKRGFLSDHDWVSDISDLRRYTPYYYWDPAGRAGLHTPMTDVYSLAVSVGETFWGEKFRPFRLEPNRVLSEDWDELLGESPFLGDSEQRILRGLHSWVREVFEAAEDFGGFLLTAKGEVTVREPLQGRTTPSERKWAVVGAALAKYPVVTESFDRIKSLQQEYETLLRTIGGGA